MGRLIIYAEEIDAFRGDLKNVLIDDKRNMERRQIISAQTGRIDSNEQAQTITVQLHSGSIHEARQGNYAVTDFITNRLLLHSDEIYNPDAKKEDKRRGEMNLRELDSQIKVNLVLLQQERIRDEIRQAWPPIAIEALGPTDFALPAVSAQEPALAPEAAAKLLPATDEVAGQPSESAHLQREINRSRIERVRRFSMPFASLFLALMAMPLGIQPPRAQKSWGITISVCLGILVFLGYYGLLTIGIIMSENGAINPHLGLWLPNVTVALAAAYSLHKMSSEKWQSILHGFEEILDNLAKRINLWQQA